MTTVGLVIDDRFLLHDTGPPHPERPERLRAISKVIEQRGFLSQCRSIPVRDVDHPLLLSIHDDAYLKRVEQACQSGASYIDVQDSAICPRSFEVARLAAGGVIAAVDEVMAGVVKRAFCAVRPPGHHAERHMSMGFCLISNVALAARYLIDRHGMDRVAIIDWDVHHGNGTQHILEEEPRALFISVHGHPDFLYPGTGYDHERGKGAGVGFTRNFPMPPDGNDEDYRKVFADGVIPALERFRPECILISAGFDAHKLDPLAPLQLETSSYGWMTEHIIQIANRYAQGRIISVLEGGYHFESLAESAALHVERLMES